MLQVWKLCNGNQGVSLTRASVQMYGCASQKNPSDTNSSFSRVFYYTLHATGLSLSSLPYLYDMHRFSGLWFGFFLVPTACNQPQVGVANRSLLNDYNLPNGCHPQIKIISKHLVIPSQPYVTKAWKTKPSKNQRSFCLSFATMFASLSSRWKINEASQP